MNFKLNIFLLLTILHLWFWKFDYLFDFRFDCEFLRWSWWSFRNHYIASFIQTKSFWFLLILRCVQSSAKLFIAELTFILPWAQSFWQLEVLVVELLLMDSVRMQGVTQAAPCILLRGKYCGWKLMNLRLSWFFAEWRLRCFIEKSKVPSSARGCGSDVLLGLIDTIWKHVLVSWNFATRLVTHNLLLLKVWRLLLQ